MVGRPVWRDGCKGLPQLDCGSASLFGGEVAAAPGFRLGAEPPAPTARSKRPRASSARATAAPAAAAASATAAAPATAAAAAPLVEWCHLCRSPRVAFSAAPLLLAEGCARLIELCRPTVLRQPRSQSYLGVADYRSAAFAACGPAAAAALEASGLAGAAAAATGVPPRPGEDLMIARTAAWAPEGGEEGDASGCAPTVKGLRALGEASGGGGMRVAEGDLDSEGFLLDEWHRDDEAGAAPPAVLNVHHDRHTNERRVATFMVYLSGVDAAMGHGGETFFPAAAAPRGDELQRELRAAYRQGTRALERTHDLAAEVEARVHAWRAAGGGGGDGPHAPEDAAYVGVGISASVGRAAVFDSAGRGAEGGGWHAPCAVTGPEEKWTLTWFKSPE